MSNKKSGSGISSKGYYIALVLCAVAIGIAGFLYYRNHDQGPALMDPQPSGQLSATTPGDVQAVATQPSEQLSQQPTVDLSKKPSVVKSPVSGQTVSPYSMDALSYNQTTRDWRVHDGVDIAAEAGTQVCAAADGTVYTVYDDETMGMTVVIRHSGDYTTKYASLAETVAVKVGDKVTAGQVIGTVGDTALLESGIGEHVHFSVSCNGTLVDPNDFLS
jgi:murein DD-endopeptidase MepM/ murein hydrolase activator NlpD